MAEAFTTSHYFRVLIFIILSLKALAFDPINPLFSFADFEKDPKFKSSVALYGNAKVVNGESKIHFSGSGTGRVIYKKPIKLFQGKPKQLASFSTYFAFSIPLENGGGGLAFVMIPSGSSQGGVFNQDSSSGFNPFGLLNNRKIEAIGVELSASRDNRNGIFTSCNVAINVGNYSVFAKTFNMALTSGTENLKLHAWIDYEASSRRLEVRLSQHGNSRPSDPLFWHSIDLSNVLKDREMFVGFFSPVKEKIASQKDSCFLYSWSFVLRHFPHSIHSEPLDPTKVFVKNTETPTTVIKPTRARSDCFSRVLAAMIFGTACGALMAFILLYLWTIFGNRRAVVPEESVMQDVVEYRKVKIVVDNNKTMGDGTKK